MTRAPEIKIGLLGLGTVGGGALQILKKNCEDIERKIGKRLIVKKALVRDINRPRTLPLEGVELTTNPLEVVDDPEIDIVVEVMGGIGDAKEHIYRALSLGKAVVTANKDLVAHSGAELFSHAESCGGSLYYEASVGGGIPIVRPLKNCLMANAIHSVIGIVNGTTNYILTQMTIAGKEFSEALYEAQVRGFAEQDPSSDLDGKDAAYKLAILASLAFQSKIDIKDVYTESMRDVSGRDILYAKELGFSIKLLAIGEEVDHGLSLRVHPALIPADHPLANVHNEFNALFVRGDAVGEVMFYGKGAGALPTGSAVVADVIEAARGVGCISRQRVSEAHFGKKSVVANDKLLSCFYLRMKAVDQPGVFAAVASTFATEQVSLDMIIQRKRDNGAAEIVLVTHDVEEQRFYRALGEIKKIESILNVSSVIRVLNWR